MDELDKLIQATRVEIQTTIPREFQELERRRDRAHMRLEILEEAARLRPGLGDVEGAATQPESVAPLALLDQVLSGEVGGQKRKGGRQLGSLSADWKRVLVAWAAADNGSGLTYREIANCAANVGVKVTEHTVRDRIRKYRDRLGFVEATGDSKHRVKKEIVARFAADLAKREPLLPPVPSIPTSMSIKENVG